METDEIKNDPDKNESKDSFNKNYDILFDKKFEEEVECVLILFCCMRESLFISLRGKQNFCKRGGTEKKETVFLRLNLRGFPSNLTRMLTDTII